MFAPASCGKQSRALEVLSHLATCNVAPDSQRGPRSRSDQRWPYPARILRRSLLVRAIRAFICVRPVSVVRSRPDRRGRAATHTTSSQRLKQQATLATGPSFGLCT
jgi:hypothetical protein